MTPTRRLLVGTAMAYATVLGIQSAAANPPFFKKVKELGYPAESCQYCHLDKLPKKEQAHEVNARGKWLFAEKQRRGVRTIDPSWLKDYPGGREQK